MLIITVKVDYWPFCGLLLTAFQAPEELKADAVNEGADIAIRIWCSAHGEKAVWEQLTPCEVIVKVVLEGATPNFNHLPLQFRGFVHDVSKIRRIGMTYSPF